MILTQSFYCKTKLSKCFFICLAITCTIMAITASLPFDAWAHNTYESAYLNGVWVQDDTGWRFQHSGNLLYASNSWGEYKGHSYYFNEEGYMVTGWQLLDGYWYYFNPANGPAGGAMMTNWVHDPSYSGWFYLSQNGIMVTGWHKISSQWYYFNPGPSGTLGQMITSQVVDGAYVDSNGQMNQLPD